MFKEICQLPRWTHGDAHALLIRTREQIDYSATDEQVQLFNAAADVADALEEAYAEICGLECDGPRALLKTNIEAALAKAGRPQI